MASRATMVLPEPTSPCTSRFIGWGDCMSAAISRSTRLCASVRRNGRMRLTASRVESVTSNAIPFPRDRRPCLRRARPSWKRNSSSWIRRTWAGLRAAFETARAGSVPERPLVAPVIISARRQIVHGVNDKIEIVERLRVRLKKIRRDAARGAVEHGGELGEGDRFAGKLARRAAPQDHLLNLIRRDFLIAQKFKRVNFPSSTAFILHTSAIYLAAPRDYVFFALQ